MQLTRNNDKSTVGIDSERLKRFAFVRTSYLDMTRMKLERQIIRLLWIHPATLKSHTALDSCRSIVAAAAAGQNVDRHSYTYSPRHCHARRPAALSQRVNPLVSPASQKALPKPLSSPLASKP